MLRVIASHSPIIIDSFLETLHFEKKEKNLIAQVYRNGETILLALEKEITPDITLWIASEYLPERLYLPYFGYTIDVVHEVGDIVVASAFFPYNACIESSEITKENRDSFIENPQFLEIFGEQKDYYVEDFGLSVGGILVDGAPLTPSDDLMGKMALAYEADIYISETIMPAIEIVRGEEIPTVILAGSILGKEHTQYKNMNPKSLVVKNMMNTVKLLEEPGEEE